MILDHPSYFLSLHRAGWRLGRQAAAIRVARGWTPPSSRGGPRLGQRQRRLPPSSHLLHRCHRAAPPLWPQARITPSHAGCCCFIRPLGVCSPTATAEAHALSDDAQHATRLCSPPTAASAGCARPLPRQRHLGSNVTIRMCREWGRGWGRSYGREGERDHALVPAASDTPRLAPRPLVTGWLKSGRQ